MGKKLARNEKKPNSFPILAVNYDLQLQLLLLLSLIALAIH